MTAKDIMTALNKLEAPKSNLGYMYTIDALLLMQEDVAYFNKITLMYQAIGKKHGSTGSRVERAIRHEVELIFTNSNLKVIEEIFGTCSKNKLSNKEFLESLYYYIYYGLLENNPNNTENIIQRIIDYFLRKIMSQPYKSLTSNIGFKAIGKSSDLRTLPLTEGRTYIPVAYSFSPADGLYTNFLVIIEGGKTIKVVKSDIGTLFKVIPYVKERLMNDETLL